MRSALMSIGLSLFAAPALAQSFDFSPPLYDRWQYPFNFTPGARPVASCFSSLGTGIPAFANFNNRDGVVVLVWNTSGMIAPGQGAANYSVASVTVTLTNEGGATWPVDLTPDAFSTFDINNDGMNNGDGIPADQPGDTDGESDDADAGRPLELFGAGFGPIFTPTTWTESSVYVGGTDAAAAARDPFPFVYQDVTGTVLHVEDSVSGRWNAGAGVSRFTPTPWAVGVPVGFNPADPNALDRSQPFDVTFSINLDLSDGRIRQYFQQQLDAGRVFVIVTSLTDTVVGGGDPGSVPSFFMKEGAALPGAKSARLTIELGSSGPLGDVDGNGCVDITDLAILLSNFGTTSGAVYGDGDLNEDGDVDIEDLAQLLANFGDGEC